MVYKKGEKLKVALTGGAAAAEALRQINPDVMPVYPITPQTPIIETFAKFQAEQQVETEIITVESEHSMMSACIGASAAGTRTVTASSSQGIALMNEILPIASGLRLPILMIVSARALSAPINIHCDHSDVMSVRDTGWIQIFSENAQEVYDNVIIGLKLAETVKLPVMIIMDGFITSHSVENLEILPDKVVKRFIGKFKPEQPLLNVSNPVTYGPVALPDSYFEFKIDQEKAIKKVNSEYLKICAEYQKISGRENGLFYDYLCQETKNILVITGSAAGTARVVADKMWDSGKKVGVLKINLFRPFPYMEISRVFKSARNIAVMDRSLSFGSYPPIYSEIVKTINIFNKPNLCKIKIGSFVYGLGGRDIFQKDIEEVFEKIITENFSKEIIFIGSKE